MIVTFEAIRDYLKANGWQKGNEGSHGGSRSLLGALYSVCGNDWDERWMTAYTVMRELAIDTDRWPGLPLDGWNDSCKSVDEVYKLLDDCIKLYKGKENGEVVV